MIQPTSPENILFSICRFIKKDQNSQKSMIDVWNTFRNMQEKSPWQKYKSQRRLQVDFYWFRSRPQNWRSPHQPQIVETYNYLWKKWTVQCSYPSLQHKINLSLLLLLPALRLVGSRHLCLVQDEIRGQWRMGWQFLWQTEHKIPTTIKTVAEARMIDKKSINELYKPVKIMMHEMITVIHSVSGGSSLHRNHQLWCILCCLNQLSRRSCWLHHCLDALPALQRFAGTLERWFFPKS